MNYQSSVTFPGQSDLMVKGLLGTEAQDAQDVHLDFHTAPDL